MEDLSALLESSFKVTNDPNSTSGVHPRYSQFKQRTVGASDQDVRRNRMLEQQKKSRHDYLSHVRNLAEGRFPSMEAESTSKSKPYNGGRQYQNQLMLSEWMVEVPEDFQENWIMVPSPVGKRVLVIASYGETSSWSKGGWLINRFPSALPGGHRRQSHWDRDLTVLDCIYSELNKTYYVLDIMNWKEQPMYDCDTEFRFYWVATKIEEIPILQEITKLNKFRFEVLPNYRCDLENIKSVLHTKMNLQLDGLLFFHKQTHYFLGSTPLVTWLKPYMIPDILGVPVAEEHMRYKPATYTTFADHLVKVKEDQGMKEEKEKTKREKRRSQTNQSMDSSDTVEGTSVNSQSSKHEGPSITTGTESVPTSRLHCGGMQGDFVGKDTDKAQDTQGSAANASLHDLGGGG